MARKRSLEEAGNDQSGSPRRSRSILEDEDDDFAREAFRDQRRYERELKAEQEAIEEAKKTNRRYIKGRKKKTRESKSDAKESYERLRGKLQLGEREAKVIQEASVTTLKQKRRKDKLASDGQEREDDQSSEDEGEREENTTKDAIETIQGSDSESEDEVILLSRPTQVEVEDRKETSSLPPDRASDSDIDEDVILLSLPTKISLASRTDNDGSIARNGNSATTQYPASYMLRTNGSNEPSSDDDLIHLSIKPSQMSQAINGNAPMPSKTMNGLTDEEIHGQERTSPDIRSTTTLLPPDGASRPCFPFTVEQASIGPLKLGDEVEVPASINRFLRDYQREGVKFFYNNYRIKNGGLLGDDMGLGKTIQVIAFLAAIMKKSGKCGIDEFRRISSIRAGRSNTNGSRASNAIWPTALIVCPASVMTNWQNELDTWGFFEHDLLDDDSMINFQRGRLDILITSHQMAKQRIAALRDQHFSVVFIDECHMLKNPNSQMTQALNSLECPCRFGLTGTAIQNRFEEFWTLLDWCNPGQFGTLKQWELLVAEPIRKGQSSAATVIQLAQARRIAVQLKECLLPPVFLRRTKTLIKAQLPNKRDNIVFCPLTEMQVASYKSILAEPEVELIRRAKEPCDCGAEDEDGLPFRRSKCCYKEGPDGKPWHFHMLKYIMLLQRCSNHLALAFPDPQDNIQITVDSSMADQMRKSRYQRQIEIVQQLFPESWQTKQNNKLNGFRQEFCGKWLVLRGLMQEWKRQGDKVLLFSLNLRLLDWISYFVEMEGYKHLRLDGSTPQKKRQGLVNEFNRDSSVFVFLISTTAGGTGLNLTGANKVVIFDPHWNPAHDLQAMDRAYRFGQMRDVDVYRLIGKGSLEETIYDRQVYKQQMGRIGYDASEERRYFKPDDAKGFVRLFELHETGNVTKDLIKACDLTEATFAMQNLVEEAEVSKIKSEDGAGAGDVDLNSLLADTTTAVPLRGGQQDDAIDRVLQMTGIDYTHVNDDLFGGSKAESAMSKRAKDLTEPEVKKPRNVKEEQPLRSKRSFPTAPDIPSWPPRRMTSRAI